MTGPRAGETLVARLRASPLFAALAPHHLEQLAAFAQEMTWGEDQVIFREGEPDDRLYLVVEGLVALETYIPGRGRTTILTVGPHEILGWSAAVPGVEKKTAGARALLATRAIAFDAAALHQACEADHDLGYQVYRILAQVIASRLKATRLQLLDVYGVGGRT
ncbi:MAG: Crp/Fnr family transcriptional regulator [Armatimonadota bacterium]|nr:Crp/Fnr family transcriptional regulator [Armatimonadota bacterium]